MKLDAHITELSANGDLLIDLSREVDVRLRFEPWSTGLRVYRASDGLWLRELEDLGIGLLGPANEAEPDLPVSRFTAGIPAEVRARAGAYQYLQTTLLQWSARDRAAAELLQRSPNLLWLLLCVATEERWPRGEIVQTLRLRRRDILGRLTGCSREGAVRVLDRLELPQGSWAEFRVVAQFMRARNGTLWRELQHWPRLSVSTLALLDRCPNLRSSRLLRHLAGRGHDRLWAGVAAAARTDRLWEDALRILGMLYTAGAIRIGDAVRTLSHCETTTAVERLHDRWAAQLNLCLAEQYAQAVQKRSARAREGRTLLPPAPIPGNADITPILSWEGLMAEGQIMHHCVASYRHQVQAGQSYIYRVLRPERATLEIKGREQNLYIAQLKLSNNRAPSTETRQAVDAWLSAFKRSGAAEPPQPPQ